MRFGEVGVSLVLVLAGNCGSCFFVGLFVLLVVSQGRKSAKFGQDRY